MHPLGGLKDGFERIRKIDVTLANSANAHDDTMPEGRQKGCLQSNEFDRSVPQDELMYVAHHQICSVDSGENSKH
jgi:hypothetical protein